MWTRLFYVISLIAMLSTVGTVSADMVAYWPFDEGSGETAFDMSGNNNHATLSENVAWGEGQLAGAIEFNGIDTAVTAPHIPFDERSFTIAMWVKPNLSADQVLFSQTGTSAAPYDSLDLHLRIYANARVRMGYYANDLTTEAIIVEDTWQHLAFTHDVENQTRRIYLNGEVAAEESGSTPFLGNTGDTHIGWWRGSQWANGVIDDVQVYDYALTQDEVKSSMEGIAGAEHPYASNPSPENGAPIESTWANLSWRPGDFAVSHDVYLGDDLDAVDHATRDSDTFRGNQRDTFYIAGFPGHAYPQGFVTGTMYYWRIDEVNEADPNSPWKGEVWSFSIPPATAHNPTPADGDEIIGLGENLSWTAGFGAKVHTVFFGNGYETVANAAEGTPVGNTTYDPGLLEVEKVYYWRVDEFAGLATHKGDVWTFTTPGAVGSPQPANGATDLSMATTLSWAAADNATSHQLYLGTDKAAVHGADTSSPEYIGPKAHGAESHDPGLLEGGRTYYWRVDEVYSGIPLKGPVWSFTVSRYLVIDDFEDYTDDDANNKAVWQHWVDGFGVADNGAQVGNLIPPYCERAIVHSGTQSMPLFYVNEAGVTNSEAVLPLVTPRDWTQAGLAELSLWVRGRSDNAAEPLYVAIFNATGAPGIVTHEESDAVTRTIWRQWRIPLQAFADRGINLTNVDKMAIGLGSKAGTVSSGGSGTMYIDDIRLYRP
jgi:hypothetical protein